MLNLSQSPVPEEQFELEVDVRLEDESGAAGLAFNADGENVHYGFYPTAGSLRLTRFEGPNVFTWTILKTVAHEAYRPGEWNRIKVRSKEGQLTCRVNGEIVIDLKDEKLKPGKVGLVKFREPMAEFRRFRLARQLPSDEIPGETVKKVTGLVAPLSEKKRLPGERIEELAGFGHHSVRVMQERAKALEKEVDRLRRMSDLVHQQVVARDLVGLLDKEKEQEIDLLHAALLIARLDNPFLEVDDYLTSVQRMADSVRSRFKKDASGEDKLDALVQYMFTESGYHGSNADYYRRSNSYINEVLDDREGLPITLSVVFVELARRLDLPVHGVGIPRHFIAMYRPDSDRKKEKLIDVFGGGVYLRRGDVEALSGYALSDEDFVPALQPILK
ncbi:MAG: transglutaminase family protein, partial [Verrucomicrobiota bacterium]